ncbi:MAG: TonB-dependent receptor [Arenicella sp.]|nr:TonB-dependent receptor [Arenicella sp.]
MSCKYKNLTALLLALYIVDLSATEIEEVAVIGTRVATSVLNLPNNVSVLDSDVLQSISAVHIQQAIGQAPGVNYQRGNGQESLPAIRSAVLTGAGACGSVLVLEQAIPVRGAGFCNVNELFDTHFEQARQIEVVRGANTAFYGSNSLTGSINVSLPSIGPDYLSFEVGANQYVRAKAAIGYGDSDTGSAYGRVYLTATEDGGYRDDSGYQQQKFSWRHHQTIAGWKVDAGVTATRLDQETAGFVVGPDSYRDPVLRKQNLDPEAFRKTSSLRAWASLSRPVGENKLLITPYIRATNMDFLQHFLPGDPLEENRQQGFGWQSSVNGSIGDKLRWALGVDGEFSDGELQQTQDKPTQGSAFLRATIPTGTHYDYQVDARQLGAFSHLTWSPDERWRLIAGLRFESMHYDYDNRALDGRTRDDGSECGFGGCRYSRPADRRDSFAHLTPKLELQYQASDDWRWYLALADSFRAPQATELYRLQRAQIAADLDEVEATTLEAGARWQSGSNRFGISVYQLQQKNLIIRDADFFNVDGQRTDSSGIELDFRHDINKQWSIAGALSYASHKYASDQFLDAININGNRVDTAPRWFGSATLSWQPTDSLGAELELVHQDEYFLEPLNRYSYPGHTLLHLRASYMMGPQWRIAFRIHNLGNRSYAERADYTTFTDERYFPGEPRSLFAEIGWTF